MVAKLQQGTLPFKIEGTDEPLIARAGLILPYEMARALKLPQVIDREFPPPGSGHSYKPSRFVMPLVLIVNRQRYWDTLGLDQWTLKACSS